MDQHFSPFDPELERLLNDPDSPLVASKVWALADALAKSAEGLPD